MKNELSDNEIDQMAKSLVQNFVIDDSTMEEIADSSKLLWNLKARIATEKSKQKTNWFFGISWQLAGLATLIVICGIMFGKLFVEFDDNKSIAFNEIVNEKSLPVDTSQVKTISKAPNVPDVIEPKVKKAKEKSIPSLLLQRKMETTSIHSETISSKVQRKTQKTEFKTQSPKTTVETEIAETKTEFIALSYSPASESGQIVRVKVPRSMMVSLGVSNNVSKNSELVNAEVIIDDDGSTRAIRFISNK
jgi:hypothetical protein